MDTKKTEEYLRELAKPDPSLPGHKDFLRITLLSARRSSRLGVVLIGLPALLIVAVIFQHIFGSVDGIAGWVERAFPSLPTNIRALLFFLFVVGFPTIAVVINFLSITYFRFDKTRREIDISIKLRWWNIILLLTGAAVASFYLVHLLADSILGGK